MESYIQEIIVSEEEIETICDEVAAKINADYANTGRKLMVISILKGASIFTAAIFKRLKKTVELEFMRVSSYGEGTISTGKVNIKLDIDKKDLSGYDVLVVEDIVDSGITLNALVPLLKGRNAASVRTCTLLDKTARREVDFVPDYIGKQIPDGFVVGYGLDYNEMYRNLPYIGILKPEVYSN